MSIITFLSDFGDRDWFVGAVKGEILKINDHCKIVDITHKLPCFDIRSAAFLLKCVYKNFPLGTVHLAVVDPGVGSKRRPIIVESDGHYFVGPDNGVFSYVYNNKSKVYKTKMNKPFSSTFHARDIFGPVAAKISKGIKPKDLGEIIKKYVKLDFPKVKTKGNEIYGEVLYIDHFGNLITNIPNYIKIDSVAVPFMAQKILIEHPDSCSGAILQFRSGQVYRTRKIKVKNFYSAGKPNELIAVKGSCGYYEIAYNKGSAKSLLRAQIGMGIIAVLA